MRPANPDRGVTCPYGKPGSAWATGEHGGIDYGCPSGDAVYSMWSGTVTGVSWGSAYGTQLVIDHDTLPDGSPGLWAVYAHLSAKHVSTGMRVQAGQLIGLSGATGNVSGPHLHVEVQRGAHWQQGNYVDPAPWVEAQAVSHGDVLLSKLRYGTTDSDSVRRLQLHLNEHPLDGGQPLPVTGNYYDETDEEVRLCQTEHGYGADPPAQSFVGPSQARHLIPAGCGCTIVDDLPANPPTQPPYWPTGQHSAGAWTEYSGKPPGTLVVHADDGYVLLDTRAEAPPADGLELHLSYWHCDLEWDDSGEAGDIRIYYLRDDDDETGYQDYTVRQGKTDFLITHGQHWETGQAGLGGTWWINVGAGIKRATITTRYAKAGGVPFLADTEIAKAAVRGGLLIAWNALGRAINSKALTKAP